MRVVLGIELIASLCNTGALVTELSFDHLYSLYCDVWKWHTFYCKRATCFVIELIFSVFQDDTSISKNYTALYKYEKFGDKMWK